MNIAILGAGAWGTALAISLSQRHVVRLWTRNRGDCEALARARASRYLPDASLPAAVDVRCDLGAALEGAELAIVTTATAGLGDTVRSIATVRADLPLAWGCKGFDTESGQLPHQIVAAALPRSSRVAALSGPSFAQEVARGQPTALVLAAGDGAFAAASAASLNSPRLRVYSSTDVAGVELGGALKNVIAIAAGISDGLALGRNARAALVTRGLAEISRLGVAMGGHMETFMGLTGLGDLVLTCTGDLSRNREVGLRLASGQQLETILRELGHVAEGVASARSVRDAARRQRVEMPICEAVCSVLFEALPPRDAVAGLLARDPRSE